MTAAPMTAALLLCSENRYYFEPRFLDPAPQPLYDVTFDDSIVLCLRVVRAMKEKALNRRIRAALTACGLTATVLSVQEGPARLFGGSLRPTLYVELELSHYDDYICVPQHKGMVTLDTAPSSMIVVPGPVTESK